MTDLRPVSHILGLLSAVLGLLMLAPAAMDWAQGDANWRVFAITGMVTTLAGVLIALASHNPASSGLSLRQTFLLTVATWSLLPGFGALPFVLGAPGATWTDAYFEAMSGVTTTGTTVFTGLDDLPPGVLLWRSILQWIGGLGIIVVALIFLPVMKVGGMQYFRSEAFDTMGKIMPRVLDISRALTQTYILLTAGAAAVYLGFGMSGFDAVNHAMTTIATGGFSTSDQSFEKFSGVPEYAAAVLMVVAGLPFIRYVQLMGGALRPLLADIQVRAFLRWVGYAVAAVALFRIATSDDGAETVLRQSLFNVVSLFTGTGYGSVGIDSWGDFPLLVVIVSGFIGACTASTGCSVKVFRYLVLIEAIKARLKQLRHPSRIIPVRLGGRAVEEDVISSVIFLFTLFVTAFMILSVLLSLTGLETRTAITAAWTAICNIGPVYGPEVGPTGAIDGFPASAKWLMIAGMLLGRLELIAVLVLFLPSFWRG